MNSMNKSCLGATICLLVFVVTLCMIIPIHAQQYFPCGVFALGNPTNFHLNNDEMNLVYGINTNYLYGVNDEQSVMNFCRDITSGEIKMNISVDPTGYQYHVFGQPPNSPLYNYYTDALWPYISRSYATHIQNSEIERFVSNVYNEYGADISGLETILIAHQGYTGDTNHSPFIQYAGERIQHYFGDDVRAVAIDNVFTIGYAALEALFQDVGNSLDTYQHEFYPFHTPVGNPVYPYNCYDFQSGVDNSIIASYEQTQQALVSSGNTHTKWELIFQVQEEYSGGHYFRRPTEAEIWLQVFLGMSRGAKGVASYLYMTDNANSFWGLVDENSPRQPIGPYYGYIADLYAHLSVLGPRILNLDVNEAFTWDDTRHQYIQSIEGDTADGSHGTIEVAIFVPYINGERYDYFMLINRRCSRDNSGTEAFPQHISLTLDTTLTGSYKIRDLYSDEIFVTNNKTFQNIELLARRGRVFELTQAYPSDISGTVYYYSQVWMVSDALMLLGSGNPADTTNATGNYEFANILPGNAHLTPSKEDDQRDGITGSDALLLLRYLAFLATLTEDQQFAADVTEDGSVSGSDAQAILRYLAFYPDGIGSTGQWRFDPPDTSWLLLDDAEADFKAFLLGDVNGDWGPISRSDSIGTLADVEIIIAAPEKNKDGLVEILIKVSKVKDPLYTFLLSISYDPKYLAFQATGQTESTEKFMVVSNGTDPDIVHLAMAGISGIKDDGEIVRLLFKGAMADLSEKDLALKLTRAIINDYDILKGNDGTISLPKRQVEQELTLIPDHYSLNQNYPNPFNPETEIRYQLPEAAHVSLAIYNLLGQKIRTLIDRNMQAGFHSVKWDGTNDAGIGIASGVYLYTLQAGSFHAINKMVLMR